MSEWEQDKQEFIEKLSHADKTFSDIFTADNEGLVIQGEERETLKELCENNKKILNKLNKKKLIMKI